MVLFALFYALVIRSPTIEDELRNDPGLLQGEEYLHRQTGAYDDDYIERQVSIAKYKVLPKPPNEEEVMKAKERR